MAIMQNQAAEQKIRPRLGGLGKLLTFPWHTNAVTPFAMLPAAWLAVGRVDRTQRRAATHVHKFVPALCRIRTGQKCGMGDEDECALLA
jgi:hypothetical protein